MKRIAWSMVAESLDKIGKLFAFALDIDDDLAVLDLEKNVFDSLVYHFAHGLNVAIDNFGCRS